MILGIGVDLVLVARMRDLHARHGERLARRILAAAELPEYDAAGDRDRFLAKRFAAKEAFAKALGTGLRAPVSLTAIRIGHDPLGRPDYGCSPELDAWLAARRIRRVHLSISDEKEHVVAFAVAET
ncbi:holo-ACP synthase [Parasulfuritortus cantonensis]|uniref:Holo-[acyl-carrier-protein] synthase n=1 Tax=Parasulfuritortus cantonensis TaxID=2528202 RepID=A0A4R1BLJ6_9PROT|nr:holo-ACP synthase [Parasulfuritortus cantonensis]TCJ18148.1 holo-ACP synthase [Parasulfuritortus cantonensis]